MNPDIHAFVLLNGRLVRGPTPIHAVDRVRVGAQCVVYCEVEGVPPSLPSRKTAELARCAGCGLPCPREIVACPSCEGRDRVDEDTLVEPTAEPRLSGVQRSPRAAPEGVSSASQHKVAAEITGGRNCS